MISKITAVNWTHLGIQYVKKTPIFGFLIRNLVMFIFQMELPYFDTVLFWIITMTTIFSNILKLVCLLVMSFQGKTTICRVFPFFRLQLLQYFLVSKLFDISYVYIFFNLQWISIPLFSGYRLALWMCLEICILNINGPDCRLCLLRKLGACNFLLVI